MRLVSSIGNELKLYTKCDALPVGCKNDNFVNFQRNQSTILFERLVLKTVYRKMQILILSATALIDVNSVNDLNT